MDDQLLTQIEFAGKYEINSEQEDFGYFIFDLDQPLAPGDSIKMDFEVVFDTKGFKESGSNNDVVFNGTFINNTYFPSIGYNSGFELSSDDDRKEQNLEVKERMMETDDPRGIAQSLFGDDADKISFEMVFSKAMDLLTN